MFLSANPRLEPDIDHRRFCSGVDFLDGNPEFGIEAGATRALPLIQWLRSIYPSLTQADLISFFIKSNSAVVYGIVILAKIAGMVALFTQF